MADHTDQAAELRMIALQMDCHTNAVREVAAKKGKSVSAYVAYLENWSARVHAVADHIDSNQMPHASTYLDL